MRIVFVAPFGIRQKTTVWARTLPLARELNRLGHSASILVPPWDSPEDAGKLIVRDGVMLEHVELAGRLPAITARLLGHINSEQPDIVHVVKPRAYAGIVQWCLWKARGAGVGSGRIVLDIDDWEQPWAAINRYPRYQARFLQWQEEWGIRHADAITAASWWLANRAQALAPDTPVRYLPNGVDIPDDPAVRSYEMHDPPCVLLFSRFMETTPAWIGEFWRALRREADDAVLLVAGKALHTGGEAAYLCALASAAGDGAANVIWLGYVDPRDLPHLYDSADCAIFPSADTALHQAKCSVRLASALQHGVPVIASSVGEQARYGAGGAARLLPPDVTPDEFARTVAEVLGNNEYRKKLGETAAKRMKSVYTWPLFGRHLEQFYQQVLSSA